MQSSPLSASAFAHWRHRLQASAQPAYLLIPELLAEDLRSGRLAPRERLPTLRDLAVQLQLNYTTVVRGFAEARQRGLIVSRPGLGSFVRGSFIGLPLRAGTGAEMTMNMPPEVTDPALLERLSVAAAQAMTAVGLQDLLRYQDFGGTPRDRAAGAQWLGRWLPQAQADRVLVSPGIHSALAALVSLLVKPGQSLAVEALVYPGLKAIASQLGVQLQPLPMDEDGLLPQPFEEACKALPIGALYLCPNLHNPTTATLPMARREWLADIAQRYSVPIIEDDAYGMLPAATPPSLAEFAPELTYHVSGLSKCLGAGLRTAYVLAPSARMADRVAGALRALTVMASPLTTAVATAWLEQGLAQEMLDALRAECAWRSARAQHWLGGQGVRTQMHGFHAWQPLPEGSDAASLAQQLRGLGVAAVAGSAFSTDRHPPEALRLCLGGPLDREDCDRALAAVAERLPPRA